jgi:hypothetical protein
MCDATDSRTLRRDASAARAQPVGFAAQVHNEEENMTNSSKLFAASMVLAMSVGLTTASQSADTHWRTHVCKTMAPTVTFQAGPRSDDTDVFATWDRAKDGLKQFVLPERTHSLNKITFKATTPADDKVYMAVTYDGRVVKKFEFNKDTGYVEITAWDKDPDCM